MYSSVPSTVEMDRSPLRALTLFDLVPPYNCCEVEMDRSPLRALMNEKEFQKACHESKLLEIIWIRMDL